MQRFQLMEPAPVAGTPLPASDPDPPTDSVTLAAPNLRAKFYLDRPSRLAAMHARQKQTA